MNYTRVYETKTIVKYEKIGEQIIETYIEIENSKIFLCKYVDGMFKGQTFIADLKQVWIVTYTRKEDEYAKE